MNRLALELNAILDDCPAGRLLSPLGRRLSFPKGIIAQSGEAKKLAATANATIGMAFRQGRPLALSAAAEAIPDITIEENVAYAPTAGLPDARQSWKEAMVKKNPSLRGRVAAIGLPILVPGITAGLSYTADLFLGKEGAIIMSDPCWDNYTLIFEGRREAHIHGVPFLKGDGLDLAMIGEAVRAEAKTGAVRIILNFPNNPSGYTPTEAEAEALCALVKEAAEGGADCLVICDDAYFGFFYEEDTYKESLFGRFAGMHERVLAVKIDGPTKEDYVWGWRAAFVTFGSKALSPQHHDALEKKMMGAIRSSVSCANTPAQSLLPKVLSDPRTAGEKERGFLLLKGRYEAVKKAVAQHADCAALSALPFNSGYFMCFRCNGVDAEVLRRRLLEDHGIGVIALGPPENGYIRLAFAGLDEEMIAPVYETVFALADKLSAADSLSAADKLSAANKVSAGDGFTASGKEGT
jgi:aspartate/methionine/tyrosine aminotransferase